MSRKLRKALMGHEVRTAREMHWNGLQDAKLLQAAWLDDFDVILTGDKSMLHQQAPKSRLVALVVLSSTDWEVIAPKVELVRDALRRCTAGSYKEVEL